MNRLRPWLRELGGEPTVIICGACAVLIISYHQGSSGYFRTLSAGRYDQHPAGGAFGYLWWFGASVVLYLIVPLMLSAVTRGSFHRAYGFGLGDWRAGLKLSALMLVVMLPATYVASTLPHFAGQYPLAGRAAYLLLPPGAPEAPSWTLFLTYELGYLAYFVAWEFLFRGWMVNGLLPRFGRAGAVLIQVAPFAIMHLGKAELEALGSIIAGMALGILALRTRSFWYGAALHGAVAVWMDWLSARAYLLRP
jgi:uncharacterized protein